jgi:hypothetical protein
VALNAAFRASTAQMRDERMHWEQPLKAAKIAQRIRKEFTKAFRALADRR